METPKGRGVDTPASPDVEVGGRGEPSDTDAHDILLVEDNPGDVDLFRHALEESAFADTLHVATTGDEALSYLRDEETAVAATEIDLVVLDLHLPDVTGFDVLDSIRADPTTRPVPVVVLSTSDDRRDVQEAYDRGANAYLEKRMGFDATVSLVESLRKFWLDAASLPE